MTSCQNVSNHLSYSSRTSPVRHSVPTLAFLGRSIILQEDVDLSMQLPSRVRLSKGSRWLNNTAL